MFAFLIDAVCGFCGFFSMLFTAHPRRAVTCMDVVPDRMSKQTFLTVLQFWTSFALIDRSPLGVYVCKSSSLIYNEFICLGSWPPRF